MAAKRPLLIALIGGVTLILAIFILVIGALTLYDPSLFSSITADYSDIIGWGGVVIGVIFLIVGLAIYGGVSLAWYIAVILFAIEVILSLISVIGGQYAYVVSFVVGLVLLYYLFRPSVKEFFKI